MILKVYLLILFGILVAVGSLTWAVQVDHSNAHKELLNQDSQVRAAYRSGWSAGREEGYKSAVMDLYYKAPLEWIIDPTTTHEYAVLWHNEGRLPFYTEQNDRESKPVK
jgi:hypothetical protein